MKTSEAYALLATGQRVELNFGQMGEIYRRLPSGEVEVGERVVERWHPFDDERRLSCGSAAKWIAAHEESIVD